MTETNSFIQRFFQMILPVSMFEDMKNESSVWMIQCSNCKHEVSIWSRGGIRWKAAGNPRVYRVCSGCGQKNWHLVYKK